MSRDEIIGDNVDIFDFHKYHHEYELTGKYFKGLERDLRTALLIDYIYNHLGEKHKDIINKTLKTKKTFAEQKAYLELILDTFETIYIYRQWYRHYAPNKPMSTVNAMFKKYENFPGLLFNKLYAAHVDIEWEDEDLWFDENPEYKYSRLSRLHGVNVTTIKKCVGYTSKTLKIPVEDVAKVLTSR